MCLKYFPSLCDCGNLMFYGMWFSFICSVPFSSSFMTEGTQSEVCSHFGNVAPKTSTLWGWSDTDRITILDVPKMLLRTEGSSGEVGVFKLLCCAFCSMRTLLAEGFGYEIALCFLGITWPSNWALLLCLFLLCAHRALFTWVPVSLAPCVVLENKSTHYLVWRQGKFAYFPQENCNKKVPRLWSFQATAILELFGTQINSRQNYVWIQRVWELGAGLPCPQEKSHG